MLKHVVSIANKSDVVALISKPFTGKTTTAKKLGVSYTVDKRREVIRGDLESTLDNDDLVNIRNDNYPIIIFDEIQTFDNSDKSRKSFMDGVELAIKHDKKVVFCGQSSKILKDLKLLNFLRKKDKSMVLINMESWDIHKNSTIGFRAIWDTLD